MAVLLQRAEDVAAEVISRLEKITVAQGAETDAGRVVLQGRRSVSREDANCISVIEGDDVINDTRRTSVDLSQKYVIVALIPCDIDNPNVAAHKVLRDIKRAIFTTAGKPDSKFGGQVDEVKYLGRDIVPRADGEALVQAIVEISVKYVENLADP